MSTVSPQEGKIHTSVGTIPSKQLGLNTTIPAVGLAPVSGSGIVCRAFWVGQSRTRSSWTAAAARPYMSAVSGSQPARRLPDDWNNTCSFTTCVNDETRLYYEKVFNEMN